MANFDSNTGQDRYKKGQKFHEHMHFVLQQRGCELLGEGTPEEDMEGIDYWYEMPKRFANCWSRWDGGSPCPIVAVDYKVMFGEHLGVQDRMRKSKTEAYVFGRVFPKKKLVAVYMISKERFWSHPRLRSRVNKHGEKYWYIHRDFVTTRDFHRLGGRYFD